MNTVLEEILKYTDPRVHGGTTSEDDSKLTKKLWVPINRQMQHSVAIWQTLRTNFYE
jgi:hypothetical protein